MSCVTTNVIAMIHLAHGFLKKLIFWCLCKIISKFGDILLVLMKRNFDGGKDFSWLGMVTVVKES